MRRTRGHATANAMWLDRVLEEQLILWVWVVLAGSLRYRKVATWSDDL